MNKKLLIATFIMLIGLSIFVVANGNYDVVAVLEEDVLLDTEDYIDVPVGAYIGGNPTGSYVILGEDTEFETEGGVKVINSGERIWCEGPPGYPEVCAGLG